MTPYSGYRDVASIGGGGRGWGVVRHRGPGRLAARAPFEALPPPRRNQRDAIVGFDHVLRSRTPSQE